MKESTNASRDFLKNSAALLGGALVGAALPGEAKADRGDAVIRIALIGCGDRGAGAAANALSAHENISLVAMADVFRDKLDYTYDNLTKITDLKGTINVPEKNKFIGFDGYLKAIALADVVLLVTPAAFRPLHFDAAVKAGKHVFMEKPLAIDAPGIRKILASGELATKKNLKVQVGLQNRYDPSFIQMVKQIKDGAIGDIVSATDYYLIGPVKHIAREAKQTELE
ncbi:MAG: Gfo/Idh/MocA family oxidoreductase, partial [Flavitalea sp.]